MNQNQCGFRNFPSDVWTLKFQLNSEELKILGVANLFSNYFLSGEAWRVVRMG